MSRISFFPRQSRLARAVRSALAMLALGAAASVWAAGATEPASSAAGGPAPLTVTVQPGQSLNDIAIAATQSRDPGVLARAGRALFDANPQAFMKRDPSRLKVGATLTVPALDANGSALAPASAGVAASGGAALAQHGASAPRATSAAQSAPGAAAAVAASSASAASAARPTPTSGASSSTAAVAAASAASAAHGPAPLESTQPATPVAGASGPHVWSGTIQSAPSSASGAAVSPSSGAPVSGAREPAGASPGNGASQPRPSSLQQLLALKNRVLMELQKHGIGKPAAPNGAAPTTATAPAAPRAAANDAAPASTAVQASDAASAVGASATQPASASARPAAPVAPASTNRTTQIDWRPTAVAGSAALVLAIWFALRRRRKAAAAAGSPADAPTDGPAEADANADDATAAPRPIGSESPILPETPVARDVISNVSVAAAAETAAEAVQPRGTDDDARSAAVRKDEPVEAPLDAAATHPSETTAETTTEHTSPATGIVGDTPADTPAAPTTDAQHAALMQNAISALNSLDMPLPPRASEDASSTDASTSEEHPSNDPSSATNGQSAPRPPVDAADSASEHRADHDDELEWDPDAAAPAARASAPSTTSSLPPLGGAQFGALKLDFDLDLPSAPGAVLPALTPDELARIARNKLDLAAEYVELGDLSGARTLLQEVVDANDAATRDDARAMLAKLADA
ncbi:pilus assembly protein FimV [Burkholderia dolosa]|uniref:Pilus assembly protein FimV n=1 Tax=Burkholderia dolosa TaxID=152500 RepID=A0A892IH11_9BURK|nr:MULTISPECIES: FimV/HubP family polar landmark protein [Burkholderia]AKE05533.1 pilus assembly protein FimV [Burkholderia cepacia]AJY09558.1 putative fimV C-domain protein [Burkholderia dolosa AU0158]AYZ94147.1 pilus assembly protein FimV [Burkholderia dolosa]ETP62110.1 FimV C- domain protein [Burkholderia dolosa PC543]MBR8417136.1 pilus assembly protein FimV [Burkholderia dolosa]